MLSAEFPRSVAESVVYAAAFQREYTRMWCLLTQYPESRICVTMEYVAPRRYESLILHANFLMPNSFYSAYAQTAVQYS